MTFNSQQGYSVVCDIEFSNESGRTTTFNLQDVLNNSKHGINVITSDYKINITGQINWNGHSPLFPAVGANVSDLEGFGATLNFFIPDYNANNVTEALNNANYLCGIETYENDSEDDTTSNESFVAHWKGFNVDIINITSTYAAFTLNIDFSTYRGLENIPINEKIFPYFYVGADAGAIELLCFEDSIDNQMNAIQYSDSEPYYISYLPYNNYYYIATEKDDNNIELENIVFNLKFNLNENYTLDDIQKITFKFYNLSLPITDSNPMLYEFNRTESGNENEMDAIEPLINPLFVTGLKDFVNGDEINGEYLYFYYGAWDPLEVPGKYEISFIFNIGDQTVEIIIPEKDDLSIPTNLYFPPFPTGGLSVGKVGTSKINNPKFEVFYPFYLNSYKMGFFSGDIYNFFGNESFSGYVSASRTTLYLTINLGLPIFSTSCRIQGRIIVRGYKGYVSGAAWNEKPASSGKYINEPLTIAHYENGVLILQLKKASGTWVADGYNNTPISAQPSAAGLSIYFE